MTEPKRTLTCKLCPFTVEDETGGHLPWRRLHEHFITEHAEERSEISAWIRLVPTPR